MTIDFTSQNIQALPPADLIGDDRVASRIYTDPEIFELEMKNIFEKTWIWVAHESELPKQGSFKTTYVARTPVIVTRDRRGNFNTLVNRCRHRGARLCGERKGEANGFTCPYHAWSFSLEGQLRGIPYADGYEGVMSKGDLGLHRLRTASYRGLIFATMNPDAPSLEEYLGDAKQWADLFLKQGGGYPIKVVGTHRFKFHGNWKIQLENTPDGYHFPIVHRSWMATIDEETSNMLAFMTDPESTSQDLGNGHSVMNMVPEHRDLDVDDGTEALQERFDHIVAQLKSAGVDDSHIRRLVRSMHGTGTNVQLFPSVALSSAFFRVLRPVSVNETIVEHLALGPDAPEDVSGPVTRGRLRVHEHFQGPFGFGTPDDAEAWDRVQAGVQGTDELPIMVNRGLNRESTSPEGWLTAHSTDETGMRAAYKMWKKMMTDV